MGSIYPLKPNLGNSVQKHYLNAYEINLKEGDLEFT
jgi:hypothetical protein